MLSSRSRKFWKGRSQKIWKVGGRNFGKVGVGYFTTSSVTLVSIHLRFCSVQIVSGKIFPLFFLQLHFGTWLYLTIFCEVMLSKVKNSKKGRRQISKLFSHFVNVKQKSVSFFCSNTQLSIVQSGLFHPFC